MRWEGHDNEVRGDTAMQRMQLGGTRQCAVGHGRRAETGRVQLGGGAATGRMQLGGVWRRVGCGCEGGW